MTKIVIRESQGFKTISIPDGVIDTLGLVVGSVLDLSIQDNKLVLAPLEQGL